MPPNLDPKIGDQFWTMLERVTKSDNIIASSPYKTQAIVNRESVEERTLIEVPLRPIKSASVIDPTMEKAAYVEVIEIRDGKVYCESLPFDKWPRKCPRSLKDHSGEVNPSDENWEMSNVKREEAIEWDGTPQNTSFKSSKNTRTVFEEDNITGDKNDLLDGKL